MHGHDPFDGEHGFVCRSKGLRLRTQRDQKYKPVTASGTTCTYTAAQPVCRYSKALEVVGQSLHSAVLHLPTPTPDVLNVVEHHHKGKEKGRVCGLNRARNPGISMVGRIGFEPMTNGLKVRYMLYVQTAFSWEIAHP